MGFKALALGLLSFLLFLSLIIFGLAFTLDRTILNPRFITSELDGVDIASILEETIDEQLSPDDTPQELKTALVNSTRRLEPTIKERIKTIIDHVYDYLLNKSDSLDIRQTLRSTFLNPDFMASLFEELDIASLSEEIINEVDLAEDFPDEFRIALINTINKLKPLLKEQMIAAIDPVFSFLLGENQSVELSDILKDIILDTGFITAMIDELDVSYLTSTFFTEQLAGQIPLETAFLIAYLDDAIDTLEPTIKNELKAAADLMVDYLLGDSSSLNVVIPLESITADLEEPLREYYEALLPAEYANLLQSQLDQLFIDFYSQFSDIIPDELVLDESVLGAEVPEQIADAINGGNDALYQLRRDINEALSEVEKHISEIKPYIGYFQLGYKLLIAFIILLILGIILIHRQVRAICRTLGVILITYGTLEIVSIIIGQMVLRNILAQHDIPTAVQGLPEQLISDVLSPLLWLSIVLLITGVVLIILPFFSRNQQETV